MIVRELIKVLNQFEPKAEVFVFVRNEGAQFIDHEAVLSIEGAGGLGCRDITDVAIYVDLDADDVAGVNDQEKDEEGS